jgi:NADH-quinone oxidoreductase subunit C
MTDEKPTPPGEDQLPETAPEETPEQQVEEKPAETAADEPSSDAPAEPEKQDEDGSADKPKEDEPAKPKLSDEEKAAKIAAAEAKAAAAKAAKEEADAVPKQPWEVKAIPPEHEEADADPDVAALSATIDGSVIAADRFAGDLTITVQRDKIAEICRFLKDQQGYTLLVDLTAVDWPEREEGGRFDVVYWMHRFEDSKRLRLVAAVPDEVPVDSVTGVWKTANWHEREVYDMFGIHFEGHPGLERILTWEGFNGHPLRKDFPVEGIDTGAAIYPDAYPPGGGPVREEELQKPEPKAKPKPRPEPKAEAEPKQETESAE